MTLTVYYFQNFQGSRVRDFANSDDNDKTIDDRV